MFDALFDLAPLWQLLVLALLSAAMLAASFGWLELLNRRFALNPKLLPVGPAFVPVTTVFALFLGFLAVDTWSQQRLATDVALKERAAWLRLSDLASPAALNLPAGTEILGRYRRAIAVDEWAGSYNRVESPAAQAALRDLRLATLGVNAPGASAALLTQWARAVDELEDARLRRLFIGADHTDDHQWMVVLVLALFVYLIIAAAHLDRPSAGRLILSLFAMAMTIALWQLAMHTNPYKGRVAGNSLLVPEAAASAAPPARP